MALVEGFGDEVIQFFGILFVVVLIILLWMSTQVAEMQIFRGAVFILERRTRRRHHDATRAAPAIPVQSLSKYIILIYYCCLTHQYCLDKSFLKNHLRKLKFV